MFPSGSLTAKILSVNLLALMILVVGVFYVGQYQTNLIDSELERLQVETLLFSRALEESAIVRGGENPRRVRQEDGPTGEFIVERARRLVERLSRSSGNRIRLLDRQGRVLIDSRRRGQIGGTHGGAIEIEPLEPLPENQEEQKKVTTTLTTLLEAIPISVELPRFPEAQKLPLVTREIESGAIAKAWRTSNKALPGDILLTAAAPVFSRAEASESSPVLAGILFVSRPGDKIREAITQVRLEVLKISAMAFVVTLLLSLYLAMKIGAPLRKLARAARRIQEGRLVADIPVYPKRSDEIGTLSVALRDMTRALEDRLDTIEQFAGDVSHELKNPLSSMRSATETLSRKIDKGQMDDDAAKLMGLLMHDIERMNRLITDISSSSRLDVALEREGRSIVDLTELLRNIIDLQSQFQRNVTLRLKRQADESYTVRGNADRLAQVFQNLIDNAASFSPPGGQVVISIGRDKSGRDAGWVVISISDSGPGIPPDKVEAIFDRFYSERPGHEDYGEHSGLGLAIAQQIIEAHRGDIRAENVKDDTGITGARFIVRLPGT